MEYLYKIGSRGQVLTWKCWSEENSVRTLSGELEGKKVESLYFTSPKNVGRSNETTAEEQALLEVSTSYKNQIDNKHYRTSIEEAKLLCATSKIPRKIHNYKDHASKLPEECFSLIKYNGSRACVIDGSLYSKIGRKERIKVPHLRKAVEILGTYGLANFDSEVYAHGLSLQRIRSAWLKPVKTEKEVIKLANDRLKVQDPSIKVTDYGSATQVLGYDPNEDAAKLRFYIFDIPQVDVPFKVRRSTLEGLYAEIDTLTPNCFKLAVCKTTDSSDDRLSLRDEVISQGYEGLVHYCSEDLYEFDKRSYTTQKDKPRYDGEALVISVERDKKGNGTLLLQASDVLDNVQFKCVMKVDRRDGKSYPKDYESMKALVDCWVTFSYEELSDLGKPTKPVGEVVRKCNSAGEPLE